MCSRRSRVSIPVLVNEPFGPSVGGIGDAVKRLVSIPVLVNEPFGPGMRGGARRGAHRVSIPVLVNEPFGPPLQSRSVITASRSQFLFW